MDFKHLLLPVKIGRMELKNRCVVPPMGTNYANPDGTVSQQMIDYYVARAKGGFGLIIVEVTAIDPLGKAIINEVGLWDDQHIPGFRKLTDAVHDAGGKIFAQLHHAGRQTVPPVIGGAQPVAPSAVPCPLMDSMPRALSSAEVWGLVGKFGDAAARASEAGFDGVEVHGAHGYLVAQFMSPHANKRLDEFGGDFMGRLKFPLEIFREVRKRVGPDYPLGFRFSYDEKVEGGRTLEESTLIARLAEAAGVDVLNISIMTYASLPYMSAPTALPQGFNQYATEVIKKCVSIPVMAVGRCTVYTAEDILANGRADLICFGRESLADPALPDKVKAGNIDDICPCIYCLQSCLGYLFDASKNKISCLANPVTGHESQCDFSPTKAPKKIMVVGGGPAGLMAAWVAAKRGHSVALYEKEPEFGGQFRTAAIPPVKHEILPLLKYYLRQGTKYGVEFHPETEVTVDLVRRQGPDVVVLATGSRPLRPAALPGIEGPRVVTAVDVLNGRVTVGPRVLIVGGGMTGAETADYLAEHKRSVTIVEMRSAIAADVESTPRYFLMQRLEQRRVEMITDTKISRFLDDGAACACAGSPVELRGFDHIVLAMGSESYNPLAEALAGLVEVRVIGDAQSPGRANSATEAGLAIGLAL